MSMSAGNIPFFFRRMTRTPPASPREDKTRGKTFSSMAPFAQSNIMLPTRCRSNPDVSPRSADPTPLNEGRTSPNEAIFSSKPLQSLSPLETDTLDSTPLNEGRTSPNEAIFIGKPQPSPSPLATYVPLGEIRAPDKEWMKEVFIPPILLHPKSR